MRGQAIGAGVAAATALLPSALAFVPPTPAATHQMPWVRASSASRSMLKPPAPSLGPRLVTIGRERVVAKAGLFGLGAPEIAVILAVGEFSFESVTIKSATTICRPSC